MEEKENQNNSTYTIEELAGRIVKLEELNEKQKQQKISLAIAIAAITIGVAGGNYIFKTAIDVHSKAIESTNTTTEATIETTVTTDEYADTTYNVYQIEEMENGNWVKKGIVTYDKDNLLISNEKVRYVLLNTYTDSFKQNNYDVVYAYQKEVKDGVNWVKQEIEFGKSVPTDTENERYVILAVVNEDNLDSTLVFQKKQRSELIENGETTGYTDWELTNDYFVGYGNSVPTDTATELYVYQGTVEDNYENSTSLNEGGISK